MAELDRRQFLTRGAGGVLSLSTLSALLAACGGDDNASSSSSGDGPAKVIASPKMGITSGLVPSYVPQIGGPVLVGAKYGLKVTPKNFTIFDSSTTLSQSTLSGQTQLAGQSTMAHLLLIEKNLPFKIFGTYVMSDDIVLAARKGIKTVQDLKRPGVVVATDSPGGSSQTVFDAMLLAKDAGFLVTDLPKAVIIESSGERASALASGDADATAIHLTQANQVNAKTGDVTILARLYQEAPNYMKDAWAARTDWLDKNQATAAAIVASTIQVSRDLSADYPKFEAAVKQLVEEPPPSNEVKELYGIIKGNPVWPVDGGLTDERVQYMIDLGRREGFLKRDLKPDDVIDRRPMQAALKLVGAA